MLPRLNPLKLLPLHRLSPATVACMSVSTKAPRFTSAGVGLVRKEFQEGVDSSSDTYGLNDSGVGLWASGRNESGLGGVAPRQRSFWLVADAELIVYGATDPSARLTIGGEEVPLSTDGTFRIQVPFRDGEQMYAI